MVVVANPSEGNPSMGKSIENFAAVTRVGLDLAMDRASEPGIIGYWRMLAEEG